MAYTARSLRTTAALAVLSLGIMALTACKGGAEDAEKDASAPSATASPSVADSGKDADPTAGPGDGDSEDSSGSPRAPRRPRSPGRTTVRTAALACARRPT